MILAIGKLDKEKIMNWYKIAFEVDDGASYTNDCALVEAINEENAITKLRNFINYLGYDICISKVYSIMEFQGTVFTGRHGWR